MSRVMFRSGGVDLRGLPFLIGPEPPSAERCLLLPVAPASVGIGRLARPENTPQGRFAIPNSESGGSSSQVLVRRPPR